MQGYRKGELLCDGMSELWFDSAADFDAFRQSPQFARALADEANFVDPSCTVVLPVDVFVIKDGPIPANNVKNIEFVNRRPGMKLAPFRDYWREVHGPIAARISVIRRYEQDHTLLSAYDGGTEPPYDGFAVTWFDSTAEMRRGTTTSEYAETRADEPHFLPDGHLPIIITREHAILGGPADRRYREARA
jgi:uncharacterized protein (TIGR02118 family)